MSICLLDRNTGPVTRPHAVPTERVSVDAEQTVSAVEINRQLAAIAELVSRVSSTDSRAEACQVLASELKNHCQAELVMLATRRRQNGPLEITAISDYMHVDHTSTLVRQGLDVALECAARRCSGNWPVEAGGQRHALLAHRRLSEQLQGRSIHTVPFRDARDQTQGVCILVSAECEEISESARSFIDASALPLGSALGLVQRAAGNRFDRLISWLLRSVNASKLKTALLCSFLTLCVLAVPQTYRVACDCELQPVTRRFIAAPFDGRLERSLVQPGDVVGAGDLLAVIDASDVQWELSAKFAEAHRVEKELAGHVVAHESGKAEIAKLELKRIQLEIDELEDQAANLEILSPISGMVLLGDHAKLEGVPLEKGKTLFEIAPLEQMTIELEIPEDDVRFVQNGMPVRVRLESFPHRPIEGSIQRVHPRSEIKEHQNVFVAEVVCDNQDGRLRPGMRGNSRVATELRPLGWIWFHKAHAKVLAWLGW